MIKEEEEKVNHLVEEQLKLFVSAINDSLLNHNKNLCML
jgi:hypothetical protein